MKTESKNRKATLEQQKAATQNELGHLNLIISDSLEIGGEDEFYAGLCREAAGLKRRIRIIDAELAAIA